MAELTIERGADVAGLAAVQARVGQNEPSGGDGTVWLARRGGEPAAGLVAYQREELRGAPGPIGLVGHYASDDDQAGSALLREAARALVADGAARVLGPMNGSTWARYRLMLPPATVTEAEEPPFLGEPANPHRYVTQFEAAGFRQVAHYESLITGDIHAADPKAVAGHARLRDAGIVWAPLQMERYDEVLDEIFELSLLAFADNLYYAPISRAEFRAHYQPLRRLVDPELVLLARGSGGVLAGFAFAFPDRLGEAAGRAGRVVLKTLVSAPSTRGLGLGGVLVDEIRRVAAGKGFNAVIHALIHVGNLSRRISERTTQRFRRYALYEWDASGGD